MYPGASRKIWTHDLLSHQASYIYPYLLYFTLMPIRSQFRPDLIPPLAAPWASVHSCRRSATATGLDHKSPGEREVCIIGHLNRCLVLSLCSLHKGQRGDGWDDGSILCKYSCNISNFLDRSCAKVRLVQGMPCTTPCLTSSVVFFWCPARNDRIWLVRLKAFCDYWGVYCA